ncbi:MAG TPA: hypothetical protein VGP93_19895 [Polyangiaceae bacterium]|jgi:hypothetical protein|nr:hypothetical protein [Polyangiaceae bacterium]
MRSRIGLRARTDFRVIASSGKRNTRCRGIEISSSGIVIDRGVSPADVPFYQWLELHLPERLRPLRALARSVWSAGTQQALKFVRISDADRLSLAEHLDLQSRRGLPVS